MPVGKRLRSFPEKRKGGAPRKPELDRWLDGGVWELRQGVHFDGTIHVFQGQLRKAANRRGLSFKYSDRGNGVIVFQAISERR